MQEKSNKKKIEEFIRVDHAGERGAIKIYEGQLLALNTIVKNEAKQINTINQSLESIFDKLNPQGNPYPSPFPLKSK